MRDVIAQRGKRLECLEIALDVVNLIERDRSVTEQVEQGVALFGKAEAAGQQLYGSDVRAADGRHNFLMRTSCWANHCMSAPKRISAHR